MVQINNVRMDHSSLFPEDQRSRNVIISIKPRYVEKILNNEKIYEFRKAIFKQKNIKYIYIYASSPVKRIVAFCEHEKIIEGTPEEVWETCRDSAGISEQEFFLYFANREKAYSIKLKNIQKLEDDFDPYRFIENFRPPQSFMYADMNFMLSVRQSSYFLH